jgi:hypothetical protein
MNDVLLQARLISGVGKYENSHTAIYRFQKEVTHRLYISNKMARKYMQKWGMRHASAGDGKKRKKKDRYRSRNKTKKNKND